MPIFNELVRDGVRDAALYAVVDDDGAKLGEVDIWSDLVMNGRSRGRPWDVREEATGNCYQGRLPSGQGAADVATARALWTQRHTGAPCP